MINFNYFQITLKNLQFMADSASTRQDLWGETNICLIRELTVIALPIICIDKRNIGFIAMLFKY